MAGNEQDLDLELPEDDEGDADEAGDESDESKEPEDKTKEKEDKRISDLQSLLDKEKTRANKLEKLVGKPAGPDGGNPPGGNDPERAALLQELREASLDAVYGEFAELKDYSIDRSLIEGRNRAEMRESAAQLVGLVKSVETKARNKALREHGIKAEPAGSTRTPPKDYTNMSSEDFEKELTRVKSGGVSNW